MSEYIGHYTISLTKRVPDMGRDIEKQARHYFEQERERIEKLLDSRMTLQCSVDMQFAVLEGREPLPEEVPDCGACKVVIAENATTTLEGSR